MSPADFFIGGAYGMVAHYNGSTWQQYPTSGLLYVDIAAIGFKGNLAIAVGIQYDPPISSKGLIMLGGR